MKGLSVQQASILLFLDVNIWETGVLPTASNGSSCQAGTQQVPWLPR